MTEATEKLKKDLSIASAMAAGMEDYLKSDILFGKMSGFNMPMLTIGGYLMRQHRLLALQKLLSIDEQAQLDKIIFQFNQALLEKIVRLETKAHKEVEARLRQMDAYLQDLRHKRASGINYATAVEPRVMITALSDKLEMPPYRLEKRLPDRIALLDRNLRRHLTPGPFIWPDGWQKAYPETKYWWLYGQPI